MKTTLIYAIAVGGVLVFLVVTKCLHYVRQALRSLKLTVDKYLVYPFAFRRHRLFGPWNPASILFQLLYVAVNAFCIGFRAKSLSEARERTGTLAVANMAPQFLGVHLSYLADLLGLSLSKYRQVHRSTGNMASALVIAYTLALVWGNARFTLQTPEDRFLIIGASSLGLLAVLSWVPVRKISYEFFLRTHQALAVLGAYALWRHLGAASRLNRVLFETSLGILCLTLAHQTWMILYRNHVYQGGFPRATIMRVGDGLRVSLKIHGRIKVLAGQYINLWIPAAGSLSFLETHPFMVASSIEGEHTTLELLVESRKGFTYRLGRLAVNTDFHWALFTGPHGTSVSLQHYERVLMVATGPGIIAQLPYLRQLIQGYYHATFHTRRIHLVWQLENLVDGAPAERLLNEALEEDAWDDNYILRVSIYHTSGDMIERRGHRRVSTYKGTMNLDRILRAEVFGAFSRLGNWDEETLVDDEPRGSSEGWDAETLVEGEVENTANTRVQLQSKKIGDGRQPGISSTSASASIFPKEGKRGGDMLVMVAACNEVRDHSQELVRKYLDEKLSLLELDYQPNR